MRWGESRNPPHRGAYIVKTSLVLVPPETNLLNFHLAAAGIEADLSMKVLEAAELIARERRGSFQIVRLNAKSLRPAEEWLAYYDKFWNRQLDALQTHLEGEDNGDDNG